MGAVRPLSSSCCTFQVAAAKARLCKLNLSERGSPRGSERSEWQGFRRDPSSDVSMYPRDGQLSIHFRCKSSDWGHRGFGALFPFFCFPSPESSGFQKGILDKPQVYKCEKLAPSSSAVGLALSWVLILRYSSWKAGVEPQGSWFSPVALLL